MYLFLNFFLCGIFLCPFPFLDFFSNINICNHVAVNISTSKKLREINGMLQYNSSCAESVIPVFFICRIRNIIGRNQGIRSKMVWPACISTVYVHQHSWQRNMDTHTINRLIDNHTSCILHVNTAEFKCGTSVQKGHCCHYTEQINIKQRTECIAFRIKTDITAYLCIKLKTV